MIKYIIRKFFNKTTVKKDCPMTIINTNRTNVIIRQREIYEKKERQRTCLSKYFDGIKGLNAIERNVYYKIPF